MITVAEFAKQVDVTPKTVYKWLKSDKIKDIKGITEVKQGVTYITSNGGNTLISMFTEVEPKLNTGQSEEIIYLREELKKEREHSRELADKLAILNHNQQELMLRFQPLLMPAENDSCSDENDNKNLNVENLHKKPTFLRGIFNKKGVK